MSQTQLASMFIGASQDTEIDEQRRREEGAIIHVLDKQSDEIIETLNSAKGEYTDAKKTDTLDNRNTFDFTALKKFEKLEKRNRLLVEDVDGFFSEYLITFTDQYKRNEKEVRSSGSFIDLQKSKVIEPQRLEGQTPQTAVQFALDGTEYLVGDVDFVNIRTITIEEHTNPYALLKLIASTFDLELRFRVEVRGNQIIGRYVDLKKYVGHFDGKEIVFGKDLVGIRRIEDSDNIVTALLGIGPEREDGTRLTVLVENEEARQRWGRNGQHLISVYEPESTDQDMTEARLRTLTENELEKRIDASVRYEGEAVSLEQVFGREHEKIRLGMTVRIKDEGYSPPLYLQARIHETTENPATRELTSFKIGDFIEYRREDLEKQVKALRSLLAQKVSETQLENFAEKKIPVQPIPPTDPVEGDKWLDTSTTIPILMVRENDEWVKAAPTEAHDIGAAQLDEVLIKNTNYNGLKWSETEGLTVERADGLVRSVMSGSDGFKVQVKDENNQWIDLFYVDENGHGKFTSGTFAGDIETIRNAIIGKTVTVGYGAQEGYSGIIFGIGEDAPSIMTNIVDGQTGGGLTAEGLFHFQDRVSIGDVELRKGIMTRVVLEISANSGNGVVNYLLGSEYVQSVQSISQGFEIILNNVRIDAIVNARVISRSSDTIVGSSNINPYFYLRTAEPDLVRIGMKSTVSSTHVALSSVSSGLFRVIISW